MGASRWMAIVLLLAITAVATAGDDAPTLAQEEQVPSLHLSCYSITTGIGVADGLC